MSREVLSKFAANMMGTAKENLRKSGALLPVLTLINTKNQQYIASLNDLDKDRWPRAAQMLTRRAGGRYLYMAHIAEAWVTTVPKGPLGEPVREEAIVIGAKDSSHDMICLIQPFERSAEGKPVFSRETYELEGDDVFSRVLDTV